MTCPHCQGAEKLFTAKVARRELKRFRRRGPSKSTKRLLEMFSDQDVRGATLLDVGGGVGAIQHEMAGRGIRRVTDVDASPAYLAAAKEEAAGRGYTDRAEYLHGDFVELAPTLPAADAVTLDRVVCCYPDAPVLLTQAADRARLLVGLVWPRDRWWTRLAGGFINTMMRLSRNPFRFRVHPDAVVEAALERRGFARRQHQKGGFWQIALYQRVGAAKGKEDRRTHAAPAA